MTSRPRRRADAGLTLIELLVAVTVGSLVVLAMAGMLANTGDIYRNTEREVEADRDGRAALERLRRDLSSRVPGLPVVFERDPETGTHALGFFTAQPALGQLPGQNAGDVCHVGYVSAITGDGGNRVSRKLYRVFESSNQAITRLRNNDAAPRAANPETDDVIAFNLFDFQVELAERTPEGAWVVPADPADASSADRARILLRLLTTSAAAELTEPSDWLPPGPENAGFDFDDEEDDDRDVRTYRGEVPLS